MKTIIGKREVTTEDVLKELHVMATNHKKYGHVHPEIGIDTLCLLLDLVTPEIMLHLEKLEAQGIVKVHPPEKGSSYRSVTILLDL